MPMVFKHKIMVISAVVFILILAAGYFTLLHFRKQGSYCLTGAFLADRPTTDSIKGFTADYGKQPAIILIFLDWGKYPDEAVIRDIYESGSALMITWEPWIAPQKTAI